MKQGKSLSFPVAISPNSEYVDCLARATQDAQSQALGVWSDPAWQPRAAAELRKSDTGFARVIGKVSRVDPSRDAYFVELDRRITLKISRADAANFPAGFFRFVMGTEIKVHGWIYIQNGSLRMAVHHPVEMN